MRWRRSFLCYLLAFNFTFSAPPSILATGLICDQPCILSTEDNLLNIHLINVKDPKLCQIPNIIVFGPESIHEYMHKKCKNQKVIFSGLLYPTLFFNSDLPGPFLSPLPGASILERYSHKFVTIYSETLEYYVSYLKRHLDLVAYKAKDIWHIEQNLNKALKQKGRTFLLLPDPLFIDRRGLKVLEITLEEQKNIKILDLLGSSENWANNIIKCTFPKREFYQTLKVLLQKDRIEKKIYFPETKFLTK